MSNAHVSFMSLIGMSLRRVKPQLIVTARIMSVQAGFVSDGKLGVSTEALESHFLAGGDVMQVLGAIVAARQAGMELGYDRAAAIDLAGRNVLEAVRTSVLPQVIDCPEPGSSGKTWLTAISKDGIELRVKVRVTVRTFLDQLIGGATEKTIIARVGQGIISSIGSAEDYNRVLSSPAQISGKVLERRLDSDSAFEVVSVDIAQIDVGENIGARLQTEQAEADARMARAEAELRLAEAVAQHQEMSADVAKAKSNLLLAEAEIPLALAVAFRSGQFATLKIFPPLNRSAS